MRLFDLVALPVPPNPLTHGVDDFVRNPCGRDFCGQDSWIEFETLARCRGRFVQTESSVLSDVYFRFAIRHLALTRGDYAA